MGVRFITGRTGTGKTTTIFNEISSRTERDPLGSPLFYLVPDQMSFTAEWHLSNYGQGSGLIRGQVTTFKRLAWRVLQESGGITREEVNGIGYRMLIRSLLREQKDDFILFQRAATKRGFTDQMELLLKEFNRYNLTPEILEASLEQLEQLGAPVPLKQKTKDLQNIAIKLQERLGTEFIDGDGHLRLLVDKIASSQLIAQGEFYIDSFTAFTPLERSIVEQLMIHANMVHIALPMNEEAEAYEEQSLFHGPAKTFVQLKEIALANDVQVTDHVQLGKQLRLQSEGLRHAEIQFDRARPLKQEKTEGLQVIEATNPRTEVAYTAAKIRDLVQLHGYRYQEIAVMHRDSTTYEKLLAMTFRQHDIPYFTNEKRPMLDHPLIELTRAMFAVAQSDFSYEAVFRAIKTGLFYPLNGSRHVWSDRLYRLENFALERGIRGDRWSDDSRFRVKRIRGLEYFQKAQTDEERAIEKELKETRDFVMSPMREAVTGLQQATSTEQIVRTLYQFMKSLQVPEKLAQWQLEAEVNLIHEEAVEHRQVWKEWIHVLDQFELMFRAQPMELEDAAAILEEGIDQLCFSKIPPAIDQVIIGQADTARYLSIKAVFVLGVNDGLFPKRIDHEGLLTDEDRTFLQQSGLELAPTTKERLLEENYILYKALTTASHQVVLSYSLATTEGKPLLPSLYLKRLQNLFTDLRPEFVSQADFDGDYPTLINHPRAALSGFALRRYSETVLDQPLTPFWQAVASYYEKDVYWSSIQLHVERPLAKKPGSEKITRETARELYSPVVKGSVSRIETYYSCPFKQFASYGLDLKERDVYQLEAPAMGDLFHAALKWIADKTTEQGVQWKELSEKHCRELAEQAVSQIIPLFVNQLLLSTNRYLYISRKLTRIVASTMIALSKQSARSSFHPIALEVGFGLGEQLPPLTIPLPNQGQLELRGRIDRVDAAKINDAYYLRIIDYKSSKRGLDLNEVYHGISLQLMTYLDVATQFADHWLEETAHPGGVLYVHLHEPTLQSADLLTPEEIASMQLKSYKMDGLLSEERPVLEAMDDQLEGHSEIIPVHVKKDGSFGVTSKVLAPEDLEKTAKFVRKRHRQAGGGILAGDARVLPYQMKNKMPCTYCSYRSVCQFDPQDIRQPVRKLRQEKPEVITQKMIEEVDNV
ncbi:helicase-exonuclease AddAB subunit AddB [Chryseomicrobium palamuruense]|uniref:Helicase-exonuclease AddAB subunit AddB n=1 Tax=Chryseomicrobium palamuruense TaxID=682973 RepID=A0ABV8UQP4_9BACL